LDISCRLALPLHAARGQLFTEFAKIYQSIIEDTIDHISCFYTGHEPLTKISGLCYQQCQMLNMRVKLYKDCGYIGLTFITGLELTIHHHFKLYDLVWIARSCVCLHVATMTKCHSFLNSASFALSRRRTVSCSLWLEGIICVRSPTFRYYSSVKMKVLRFPLDLSNLLQINFKV
jgi:hypothetical protein